MLEIPKPVNITPIVARTIKSLVFSLLINIPPKYHIFTRSGKVYLINYITVNQ